MKIAVMGTGGVGGYFGGLRARAGQDVTFIARGPHLDAIKRDGLRVASDLSGEFTVDATATDDIASLGTMDLVLYTVKMHQNEEAIRAVAPMVGPDTVVLTLQNGIDNGDKLAAELGQSHVMIGIALVQARIGGPGLIEQLGQVGRIVFGEVAPGLTPRGENLLEQFRAGGWNAELSDNALRALWQKFIYLTASASVNAVTQIEFGEMRTVTETRELLALAFQEIIDVGRAHGAPIDGDIMEWCMSSLDGFPAGGMSSLANDFRLRRRVELEGLTGTVVRLGREAQVPTPIHSTIYALLKPAANTIEKAYLAGRDQ